MSEMAEVMANDAVIAPLPKRNNGWFRTGDRRINREGRPRGSKATASVDPRLIDRAAVAGRYALLFVSAHVLSSCLSRMKAPWMVNLPSDFQIVGSRFDPNLNGVVFTIRSETLPRIARGAVIPEFRPVYNGLMWCR